jgi:erythronate-4-phosphate dehydrogenase
MRKPKVVADDKIPFLRGVLEPYADVVYLPGAAITRADVRDADALFTRTRTRCDAALLQGSRVRLIATATIGCDHIDTDWCEAQNIRWVNAPGCNASSVRQYIAAVLVTLAREHGLRLREQTLGVIGVGNVGRKVAVAAAALGMRVLLNDPPRAARESIPGFVPLDELLAQSDIVTCHTPLTKDAPFPTYHLASDAFFRQMKTGAVFINSSRGAVVDSGALKRAARTKLSAFVLDVWEGEPHPDPELLANAFIGTPHIAGYSADGKANGTAACIRRFSRQFGPELLSEWYPKTIPPSPFPPLLETDCAGKTDDDVFYEAVTHTYPIHEDSLRLKHSPATFEQQRGNYWIRREFDSFTVRLQHARPILTQGLKVLGFKIRRPEARIRPA